MWSRLKNRFLDAYVPEIRTVSWSQREAYLNEARGSRWWPIWANLIGSAAVCVLVYALIMSLPIGWEQGLIGWLWMVGAITAISLFIRYWLRGHVRHYAAQLTEEAPSPHCTTCDYDLRGTTGTTCPECGSETLAADAVD